MMFVNLQVLDIFPFSCSHKNDFEIKRFSKTYETFQMKTYSSSFLHNGEFLFCRLYLDIICRKYTKATSKRSGDML